jgi:phosphoadenosine phosphosulfate reductase
MKGDYSMSDFQKFFDLSKDHQKVLLNQGNDVLSTKTAEQRVSWALENLPQQFIISSSFGIQAAVMLHLVTEQYPSIPVVLLDTGYLFPETYQFIDELTERLNLNLKVYRAEQSPSWQEARYGKLWEKDVEGITQ